MTVRVSEDGVPVDVVVVGGGERGAQEEVEGGYHAQEAGLAGGGVEALGAPVAHVVGVLCEEGLGFGEVRDCGEGHAKVDVGVRDGRRRTRSGLACVVDTRLICAGARPSPK